MSHLFAHSLRDGEPSLALTEPGKGLRRRCCRASRVSEGEGRKNFRGSPEKWEVAWGRVCILRAVGFGPVTFVLSSHVPLLSTAGPPRAHVLRALGRTSDHGGRGEASGLQRVNTDGA